MELTPKGHLIYPRCAICLHFMKEHWQMDYTKDYLQPDSCWFDRMNVHPVNGLDHCKNFTKRIRQPKW